MVIAGVGWGGLDLGARIFLWVGVAKLVKLADCGYGVQVRELVDSYAECHAGEAWRWIRFAKS